MELSINRGHAQEVQPKKTPAAPRRNAQVLGTEAGLDIRPEVQAYIDEAIGKMQRAPRIDVSLVPLKPNRGSGIRVKLI
jgi:hypothetical protein